MAASEQNFERVSSKPAEGEIVFVEGGVAVYRGGLPIGRLADVMADSKRLDWLESVGYEVLRQGGKVQIALTSGVPGLFAMQAEADTVRAAIDNAFAAVQSEREEDKSQ